VKLVLSVIWLALAVGFVQLGRQLGAEVERPLPELQTQSPQFEIAGEGFHIELDVAGTPLNEPFERMKREVETYLEEVRADVDRRSRHVVLACWLGAAASLAGLALLWAPARRRPAAQG
jgi:hypothetical protein